MSFELNKLLKKQNNSFLLNERSYWTIVQWKNKRNSWKINKHFINERNQFLLNDWKKRNEMVRSRTMNERNEKKPERANLYLQL